MADFEVRALTANDETAVAAQLRDRWGSTRMVSRGKLHEIPEQAGFGAFDGDKLLGVLTYEITGDSMEIVFIESVEQRAGIGTALISAATQKAGDAGCSSIWLVTTNDNLNALGFYQRHGFTLKALHREALEESRKLKPEISEIGADGIPLRDEIELEYLL